MRCSFWMNIEILCVYMGYEEGRQPVSKEKLRERLKYLSKQYQDIQKKLRNATDEEKGQLNRNLKDLEGSIEYLRKKLK